MMETRRLTEGILVLRGTCAPCKVTHHETITEEWVKYTRTYQNNIDNDRGICKSHELEDDCRRYCPDGPQGDQTSDGDKNKVGRA